MKMKRYLLGVVLVVVPLIAWAGTLTETRTGLGSVQKITLTWASATNAGSGVAGTTDPVNGVITRVLINPTTAATAATYSITLSAAGVDLLNSLAATAATGAVTQISPGTAVIAAGYTSAIPYSVADQLAVVVTNCGPSASGSLLLYVTP